jgi:uncharacterized phage-associated protein
VVPTASDIAQYYLSLAADESEPELMTNLRIQKLLYYAQGFSLAFRNRQLFAEVIQAWRLGPVVPEVYQEFAHLKDGPITPAEMRAHRLSDEDQEFISSVWQEYRKHSAIALARMTHNEPPWREARRGLPDDASSSRPMTDESLKRYFDAMCNYEMCKRSGVSIAEIREAEEDAKSGRTSSWDDVKERLGKSSQS